MLDELAHYKILERIGAGGMGEVFRARDKRLGRTVAIKLLPPDVAGDPDRRDRFVRDARAAAALSHPNIAALYEVGEDQGHLFLVFEFVPGTSLPTAIAGRPMNPSRAVELAVQIADALAEAHAAGLIHRDIKPDTIMVTPKGHAKILDFGLASWTAGGAARDQVPTMLATGVAAAMSTVAYMSPEQALGEAVDERTDTFSLGLVLFEMLTGKPPFTGVTPTALSLQLVQAPAPAPSSLVKDLPKELDPVVARALSKSVGPRYEAATLAAELRAILAMLEVRSERLEHRVEAAAAAPRRRAGAFIAAIVFLVALAGCIWLAREPIRRLWRQWAGPRPSPVVAVLPLELQDADRSQQYFADGLTEDLITRLGQTPGVRVPGRATMRAYHGRSPADLARELNAGVVLTGSVRPSADAVTISLALVDPTDGLVLWTNQYTRDVRNIFEVQAQVAADVAGALRLTPQPTAAAARTASRLVEPRAYHEYLQGREALAMRRIDDATRHFQQAIQIDAGLAEAYAGFAEAVHREWSLLGSPDDPARLTALKSAADRAIELDPDLPQANLAVALAADSLPDALKALTHSIAIDPTYSEGYHQIGDQILDVDPGRAIAFYQRALALDPRLSGGRSGLMRAWSALGRYDDVRKALAATGVADASWTVSARLALALDTGDFATALTVLDPALMAEAPVFRLSRISALRMAGRSDDAYAEAVQLTAKEPVRCEPVALLAGLRAERGQIAQARQLVAPAVATPATEPAAARCAALSAAAIGDAASAAATLQRIAADERLLRGWANEITGTTGSTLLRRSMFPWTHVRDATAVAAAKAALDAAYAERRVQIAGLLDGLPRPD